MHGHSGLAPWRYKWTPTHFIVSSTDQEECNGQNSEFQNEAEMNSNPDPPASLSYENGTAFRTFTNKTNRSQ